MNTTHPTEYLALDMALTIEALRNFRTWFANRFGDFDDATNAQLLCLDNEAAHALGDAECNFDHQCNQSVGG